MTKIITVHAQQKWDYCFETRKTETSLLISLNKFGQEGWELVEVLYYKDLKGVMTWTAFLKRPSIAQVSASGPQPAVAAASAPAGQTEQQPAGPQGFDLSGDEFPLKAE